MGSQPIPESLPIVPGQDGSYVIEFAGVDLGAVARMVREGAGVPDIQKRIPDCPEWVLFQIFGFCLVNVNAVDKYLQGDGLTGDMLPAWLPLTRDDQGLIRITAPGEPYLFEILVNADSPEDVVTLFPEIPLGVAYQIIGYYLKHRAHIDFEISEGTGAEPAMSERPEPRWFPALFPRRPDRRK